MNPQKPDNVIENTVPGEVIRFILRHSEIWQKIRGFVRGTDVYDMQLVSTSKVYILLSFFLIALEQMMHCV